MKEDDKEMTNKYANLNLNDAIKLYADVIAGDKILGRIELHDRLCELLAVSKEEFNPFFHNMGWFIHNPLHAEQIIRNEIKKILESRLEIKPQR